MANLEHLPVEVLTDICLYVCLSSGSELVDEIPEDVDIPHEFSEAGLTGPFMRNIANLLSRDSNSKLLTHAFSTGMDRFHDCPGPDLVALYEGMIRHRCDRESIRAVSLVCKRLRDVGQPLLWALVEIDQRSETLVADTVQVLSTVFQRPDLAYHVKALSLRHFYNTDSFSRAFTHLEDNSLSTFPNWDTTRRMSTLLNLIPNLQSLKLVVESFPIYWDVFNPSPSLYSSGLPLGLQNLTELSFHWEDPDADAFLYSCIVPLFLLPNLKTLYLGRPIACDVEGTDCTQHFGKSSITNLIIHFGLIEASALDTMLQLPAALESFTYSYGGGSNRCSNADLLEYFRALLPQLTTLKKMRIRGCRDMQSSEDEWAPAPDVLKSFVALEELSCPARLLLLKLPLHTWPGYTMGDWSDVYQLEDVLPPNVENLTLYAYDDWPFHAISENIGRFMQLGRISCPALKKLRIDCWLHEEDYELYSDDLDEVDVIRNIKHAMSIMEQSGKAEGIEIEMKLDTISKTMNG